MKKYLKNGVALLLPFALVVWIVMWFYGKGQLVVDLIVPVSWGSEWWYPILGIIAIVLTIIIIGFVLDMIKPLKWLFKKTEDLIITRIPVVNKIYGFGKEVVDSLITDVKGDGVVIIVEVETSMGKMLGMLTDPINHIIAIPTTPNPTNGFLVKREDYKIIDKMAMGDFLKIVGSMGKIGAQNWK